MAPIYYSNFLPDFFSLPAMIRLAASRIVLAAAAVIA